MDKLKQQYNELLMRFYKAEMYLDDETIPLESREKQIKRASDIIAGLNALLKEIRREYSYTEHEVLNGFYYKI